MFNFTFKNPQDKKDLSILVNFLIKQDLGYPNYEDWVQKAESEIDSGYKRAIMAFSNKHIVGDLIYQPHKTIPLVMELKNLRIHNEFKNRYFANFMLRQAEHESKGYLWFFSNSQKAFI